MNKEKFLSEEQAGAGVVQELQEAITEPIPGVDTFDKARLQHALFVFLDLAVEKALDRAEAARVAALGATRP